VIGGTRAASALFAGAMVLLITGCSSWFLQEDRGPFPEATLEEIRNGLESRTRGLSSLKALMALRVMGSERLTASLVWQRPQQLRFRGFDPLGRTLFEVVVSEGFVHWGVPGRPPVPLGPVEQVSQSVVDETEALPVAIEDLVRIMEAMSGPAFRVGERPLLERPPGLYYILHSVITEGDTARLTKRFWIERRRLRLAREGFFRPDGFLDLALDFSDYRPTEQGEWPHQITVLKTGESRTVEAVIREIRFNVPIAPEEFRLAGGAVP
jgi:outer membrane lipoprotein-sorting protein